MLIISTFQFMIFNLLISINKGSKFKQINGINFLRLKLANIWPVFLNILRHFRNNYKYYVPQLIIIGSSVCVLRYLYMSIHLNDNSNKTFWDVLEMLFTLFPIVSGLSVFIQIYLPNKPHINIDDSYEKLSIGNKIISSITLPKFAVLVLAVCLSKYCIIPLVISILSICLCLLEELGVFIKDFTICQIKIICIKSTMKHASFVRPGRIYTDCNIKNTYGYKTSKHLMYYGREFNVRSTRLSKMNSLGMWNNNNNNNALFGKEMMDKFKHDFLIEKQFNFMLQNNYVKRVMLDIASSVEGEVMSSIVLHESLNGEYVRPTDLKKLLYEIQHNHTINGICYYPQNMLNGLFECSNNHNNIGYYIDLQNQFRFIIGLNNPEIINLASSSIISLSDQITTYLTSIQSDRINLASSSSIISLSEQITTYLTPVRSEILSIRTNISSPPITNNDIINLTGHNNSYSWSDFDQLYISQIVQNRDRNINIDMMPNVTYHTTVLLPEHQFNISLIAHTPNFANYELYCKDIPRQVISGLNEFCDKKFAVILRLYNAIHRNYVRMLPYPYRDRKEFLEFFFVNPDKNKVAIIKACILDIFYAKCSFYNKSMHELGTSRFKFIDQTTLNNSSNHELNILLNCVNSNNYTLLPNTFSKAFEKDELGTIEYFPEQKQKLIKNIQDTITKVEKWLHTHLLYSNEYKHMSDADFKMQLEGKPIPSFDYENTDNLTYLNLDSDYILRDNEKYNIFSKDLEDNYLYLAVQPYNWDVTIHNLVNTGYIRVVDIDRHVDNESSYLLVYDALSKAVSDAYLNKAATELVMFKPGNLQYIFKTFKFTWSNTNPPIELSGWGVIMHCVVSMQDEITCIYSAHNDIIKTHIFYMAGAEWDKSPFIGSDLNNHWPDMYNLIKNIVEKYGDDDFKDYFNTRFNTDINGLSKIALTFKHNVKKLAYSYSSNSRIQNKLLKQIDAKYPNIFMSERVKYSKYAHNANIKLKMPLSSNY